MAYKFSAEVKECWEKQMQFLGRDPKRWRLDVDGKPVMKELEGKDGICGFHYDHIIPEAAAKTLPKTEQDKLAKVSNCQVLRSSAFRRKKESEPDAIKELLCDVELNDAEKDIVEMTVHGSLTDEMGRKKCKCISKMDIGGVYSGTVLPCEHPMTGRNLCQEMRERLETMLKGLDI